MLILMKLVKIIKLKLNIKAEIMKNEEIEKKLKNLKNIKHKIRKLLKIL